MRTSFLRFRSPAPRLLAVLLLLAAGCQGDTLAPDRAAALRAVSGADQTALPGEAVADPLRVRVEDAAGKPVRGATVDWTVALGGGSVDAARTVTDDDGFATVRWTLGEAPGEQRVEARVPGTPAAVFGALATEVAEFRLSPRHARLGAPGEELVLRLLTRGAEGGDLASGVVTWHSTDPEVVSVFGGRIRAVGRGAATIIATGDGVADTMLVSVGIAANEPVAVTGQAQQRTTASEVTLAGTAAGNGYEGTAWLEWGRQPDLSDAAQVGSAALAATGTRGLAATVGGFALNDTLYFRAAAQTSQGLTRGSIARYVVAPPGPATGLAAQLGPPNFLLRLSWTVPEGTYGYAAERREPGEAGWTSSPVYTSSTGGYWAYYPGLHDTRTVEFRVRSCNAVGCTYSGVVQVVIPRLDPPQGVAAAVTDSGHVRLAWTDAPHETSYAVFRRIEGSPEPAQHLGTAARNATGYTDRTVLPGVTYWYSVASDLSFGSRRSAASGEVAAHPGGSETYPPTAVTGTGIQNTSATSVTLRGAANGNNFAGHAWIEWGLQPDLSDAAVVGRDTLPATGDRAVSGTATGLPAGATVYFRAVAENRYATVRGAINSYTVAPPTVSELRVEYGPANYLLKLYWTADPGTTRYGVEQRNQGETAWRSSPLYASSSGGYWAEYPDLSVTRTVEYRVRACNAVGCVHSAPVSQLLPRLEPPTNLSATPNAALDVVLSWTGNSVATRWEVFRRVTGTPEPAVQIASTARAVTHYTDSTALEGVTYAYAVRSLLTAGSRRSVFGGEATATPGGGATYPPTATTGTAIQPVGGDVEPDPTAATLRGSAAGNNFAGHAWFEYGTSPNLSGAAIVGRDTLPATGTRALVAYVTGLAPGSTFYYRMVAENRYGTVRGAIASYTVAPPAAPTALLVEYGPANYLLKLYWTVGERAAGYAVAYRNQGTTAWTSSRVYTSSTGGYWAIYPSLDSTRTVELRVQSCNAVGCTYSAPVTQLVQRFEPPAGLAAAVNGAGNVVLSWTDASMETSYEIYRRVQGSAAGPAQIGTAARNATGFTDATAASGVTYVYTVRGFLSLGSRRSGPSNEAAVAVP